MVKAGKKGHSAVVAPAPVSRPGDLSALTLHGPGEPKGLENQNQPAGNGVSAEELVRKSNMWRDNYNPLRGLTIAWLMAIFEQAERGAFAEVQLLLRKCEKRFPILKGFIEKLLSSVEELEWDVKVMEKLPAGATPVMAKSQRDWLQSRYDLLKNFNHALGELALADVRGYAVLQKHRFQGGPNDGAVEELYWVEPWCWCRDGYYGDFYYNEISRLGIGLGTCQATLGEGNRIGSDALPRTDFVVRECVAPLYEIALIAFVNWLMARKDYAAFVELFGLPNWLVIMPPNIPQGKEMEYQAAAEKIARGVSGALPNGADAKSPSASIRMEAPFAAFGELQEKDVVLAGTGGELTMISQPTGIGKGASEEHDAAWQKIAVNKARRINEVLQRDFDAVELAEKFPGQPVCVYFELRVKDDEEVGDFLDNVIKGDALGLAVETSEIAERTGIKFKDKPEPPPGSDPTSAAPNLQAMPQKAAMRIDDRAISAAVRNRSAVAAPAAEVKPFAAAVSADVSPVLARLQAICEIQDDAIFEQKLKAFYADFPQLQNDVLQDPSADRALLPLITGALAAGLKKKTP